MILQKLKLSRRPSEPDVAEFDRQLAELRAKLKAAKRGRIRRWILMAAWSVALSLGSFQAGRFWSGTIHAPSIAGPMRAAAPVAPETILVQGPAPAPRIIEVPQHQTTKKVYTGPRGGRYHYSASGSKVYERK